MITIRFSGRRPSPGCIEMGQETDSGAEKIRFLLPQIGENQVATVQMILPDGKADAVTIEDSMITVPARLAEMAGRSRAWVEILADGVAWHSEIFYLDVGELPPISERTEQEYPTAFQEAIARSEAAKRAAEIAAAIARSAQGNVTVAINGDGDLIVTYEDTEGETHEANLGPVSAYTVAKKYGYTGTEQGWEEAIASVGEKSDAAAQSAEDAAASAEEAQAANTAAQAAKTAAQTAQEAAETAAARDVTEWLNEHAGTAQEIAVIDDTLSIEGAAAESQATGAVMAANGLAMPITEGWHEKQRMAIPAVGAQVTDIPNQGTSVSDQWRYAKIACNPGDRFVINAQCGNATTYRVWAFVDSSLAVLSRDDGYGAINEEIIAPDDAAYLYINQNAERGDCYDALTIKEQITALEQGLGAVETLAEENAAAIQEAQTVIDNAFAYQGAAKSEDYDGHLSSIVDTGIYYLYGASNARGAFDDRPVGAAGAAVLLVYPVLTTFALQNLVDVAGNNFWRYVYQNGTGKYTPSGLSVDENGWFLPRNPDTEALKARQRWAGKRIVFFGDSRTWYDGKPYPNTAKSEFVGKICVGYQQQCVKLLGITAINQGDSGKNTAEISQNIIAYGNGFENVDAVYISGGVNDFILSRSKIGALDTDGGPYDTSTAYGGLQTAIEWLLTNYPKMKIFVEVPPIAWRGENGDVYPYATACLKRDVAEFYNLPCLDLYKNSGINAINRSDFYADDPDPAKTNYWYLHFNDYGNERLGQIVAEFINTH